MPEAQYTYSTAPPLDTTRARWASSSRSAMSRARISPAWLQVSYSIRHSVFSRSGTSRRVNSRSTAAWSNARVASGLSGCRSTASGSPCRVGRVTDLIANSPHGITPAGWASYGYCASHSRRFWGPRPHLVTTLHGLHRGIRPGHRKTDEHEALIDLFDLDTGLLTHPDRLILVIDKGYRDTTTERHLTEHGVTMIRPAYRTEQPHPRRTLLRAVTGRRAYSF